MNSTTNELPCILFVDDEREVTRGIRLALRKEPYKVLIANSAKDGLALLQQTNIDIVISDERMPEMGGAEFLTIVRKLYPETIRLILSGQSSLESAIGAINDAGIYRFLRKPCDPHELALCLGEALEAHAANRRFGAWEEDHGVETLKRGEEQFERALDEAWMAFQPIIRTTDKSVFAYEALLRVDNGETSGPGELFALAERLDRVQDLERTIRALVGARLSEVPPDTNILININPTSLSDDLLYSADTELSKHAAKVVIEITERDTVHDIPDLQAKIARLRELGFRIAVDDLGAGYAGLTSFALISPDIVKFDMDLIQGIHREPTKAKLVSSFTTLCRELGVMTIAEGVEVLEERDRVIELNCDLIQGFFYAPPGREFLPADTDFREAG